MELEDYIVLFQIPIVAFLGVVSFQARAALRHDGFLWVGVGWLVNLLYLVCSHGPVASSVLRGTNVEQLSSTLDVVTALCFLRACPPRSRGASAAVHSVLAAGLLLALVLPHLASEATGAILLTVGSIVGTYSLAMFYRLATAPSEYHSQVSSLLLLFGAWLYCAIQPLYVVGFFYGWAHGVGFVLGMVAKVAVAFGLVSALASAAVAGAVSEQELRHVRDLRSTVERLLHEIGTHIGQIGLHIAKLQPLAPRGAFGAQLEALDSAYLRLGATAEAAKQLLPNPATLASLRHTTSFRNIPRFLEEQVISVNTLIQLAKMSLKDTRSERVSVRTAFSARTTVACIPIDLTLVMINLLRNSYDAMPDGTGMVAVTTTNDVVADRHVVQIVVEDDGEGVSPTIRDRVFEEGFTTRDGVGRGHGLATVRDLVAKNSGTLDLVSPVRDHGLRPGTRVIITFPRVGTEEQ